MFRRKRKKKIWRQREQRIVKKFAWLPIKCRKDYDSHSEEEIRWWQIVYVVQEYEQSWNYSDWTNIKFATEEEYEAYCNEREEWER